MNGLTDKHKLSVRSTGMVHEAVNALVSRYRTTGEVQVDGDKVNKEDVVNAAVVFVLGLPVQQRTDAILAGLQQLMRMLNREGDAASVSPQPGHVIPAVVLDPKTGQPPKPRGKRKGAG